MALELNQIFIETLNDLEDKIKNSPNEYKVLRASALLRQLIGEGGSSLVNQVNKKEEIKLKFRIAGKSDKEFPMPEFLKIKGILWRFIYPGKNVATHDLSQADFLQYPILVYYGEEFSVINAIRTTAHILGGVHLPTTEKLDKLNDRERRFVEVTKSLNINGVDSMSHCIHGISFVVLDALAPLIEAIKKK